MTELGRSQAARLADELAGRPIAAIYCSPRRRTYETAQSLARPHGLPVIVEPALDEIDFGTWTGRRFDELAGDPEWDRWNMTRGSSRCPGGESMTEAVSRASAFLEDLERRQDGAEIAVVTHCDIIRGLLCRAHGRSLDEILSFEVEPASVTHLKIGSAEKAAA